MEIKKKSIQQINLSTDLDDSAKNLIMQVI